MPGLPGLHQPWAVKPYHRSGPMDRQIGECGYLGQLFAQAAHHFDLLGPSNTWLCLATVTAIRLLFPNVKPPAGIFGFDIVMLFGLRRAALDWVGRCLSW